MSPVLAGLALVIALAVVVILIAMRKKTASPAAHAPVSPTASAPVSPPASAPVSPPASATAGRATLAAATRPVSAPAPIAAAAKPAPAVGELPAVLDKVSCTFNTALHGAMPPFGKLSFSGGVVLFEASSRVVTKAGGLGEDGSSTLQSLGAIEMGKFRFEIEAATVQRIDFGPKSATVHADSGTYLFEGLATCGPLLKPWFGSHGLED